MRDEVSIVVPTFQEAANLPVLVSSLSSALCDRNIEWELILVDDDSNDGIEAIAAELARRLPIRIEIRRGVPRDLSFSVLRGMRIASFDRQVVMDADLSHPPEGILDLLAALDADCDLVVGSRYVPGARIDDAWGRRRVLISRVGTLLARPLANCRDPLSGFFAIDRRRLPDLDGLRPLGYKIALELMARWQLRVREVPIRFSTRRRGRSKVDWRILLGFLQHLFRLYVFRFRETIALSRQSTPS